MKSPQKRPWIKLKKAQQQIENKQSKMKIAGKTKMTLEAGFLKTMMTRLINLNQRRGFTTSRK